jgi:hypothetical protein
MADMRRGCGIGGELRIVLLVDDDPGREVAVVTLRELRPLEADALLVHVEPGQAAVDVLGILVQVLLMSGGEGARLG